MYNFERWTNSINPLILEMCSMFNINVRIIEWKETHNEIASATFRRQVAVAQSV
jgi:P2-related tail formation protein